MIATPVFLIIKQAFQTFKVSIFCFLRPSQGLKIIWCWIHSKIMSTLPTPRVTSTAFQSASRTNHWTFFKVLQAVFLLNERYTYSVTHVVFKKIERFAQFEESFSFKTAGLLSSDRAIPAWWNRLHASYYEKLRQSNERNFCVKCVFGFVFVCPSPFNQILEKTSIILSAVIQWQSFVSRLSVSL